LRQMAQKRIERAELIVHRDAQGLEDAADGIVRLDARE
jgi:hypothetical protein